MSEPREQILAALVDMDVTVVGTEVRTRFVGGGVGDKLRCVMHIDGPRDSPDPGSVTLHLTHEQADFFLRAFRPDRAGKL